MSKPVKSKIKDEVVKSLKCKHGCDESIMGLVYFPSGCICFEDTIQALCAQHFYKAQGNGIPMLILLEFE